jgi:hypothetical protein
LHTTPAQDGLEVGLLRVAVLVCTVVAAASLPAAAESQASAGNPFVGASRGALVLFVPLDAHARQLLAGTVPALRRWVPSDQLLRVIPTEADWISTSRGGERNSRAISSDLLSQFRRAQGRRSVLIMAVTSQALYDPNEPALSFVFGSWNGVHPAQYAAVVGTHPMRVFQPELERARLTKMMLRYIGEIVCGLMRSSDRTSVMYAPLLGTPDLDRMVAKLPPNCRRR